MIGNNTYIIIVDNKWRLIKAKCNNVQVFFITIGKIKAKNNFVRKK